MFAIGCDDHDALDASRRTGAGGQDFKDVAGEGGADARDQQVDLFSR
jgi:hypothetical protein